MPNPNPKSLACPACGAPLNYDGRSTIVKCTFCQNVVVLEGLKPETAKPEATKSPRPARPAKSLDEIVALLRRGKKDEAVKRYRELYDVSQARAQYAIEQIEAGNLQNPEAGFPTREAEFKPVTATPRASRAAPATRSWSGCVITGLIFLFIGGIVGYALLQPGGPFIPRLSAMEQSMTVPAAQDTAPDVVALFYESNDEVHLLGRVNRADGKLAWKTDPLPGDGYVDDMARDDERVYVTVEAELLAFDLADGRLAWEITLPDKLDAGDDNLVIQDGMVIVMTMDRTIQAYEAATGKEVWSRPLLSYARGLQTMGKWLVVLDYISGGYDLNIFLLDPADGSEERIIFPVCQSDSSWEENLSNDSGIIYDDSTNALYLLFGSSFGCIQRYDLGSGQLTWETQSDDSFGHSFYGFHSIQTPDVIYYGNDSKLYRLDKRSGALKTLVQDEAYVMVPLALDGDTLLTLARRTKGSERFELWGVDSVSGKRTWQLIPENSRPIDPPYAMSGLLDKDESGWTWKMTPNGLLLIQFQAEPNQLVLTTYDPANGSQLGQKTISIDGIFGDFYSVPVVIDWRGSDVYFILDGKVYVLNVDSLQWILKYQ